MCFLFLFVLFCCFLFFVYSLCFRCVVFVLLFVLWGGGSFYICCAFFLCFFAVIIVGGFVTFQKYVFENNKTKNIIRHYKLSLWYKVYKRYNAANQGY